MRDKSKHSRGAASAPEPSIGQPSVDEPIHRVKFSTRLRNYFLTGLVVVGPVTITLAIAWYVITSFDTWVKPYIPRAYNPDNYLPFALPGAGLVCVIVALTLIGALAANLIGRSLISAGEVMLDRLPLVRRVYKPVKQIFESVVTATGPDQPFKSAAVMEFPSPGIYAIVFITGSAAKEIVAAVAPGQDLVTVFMPTHLMPPSGFTVFVPRDKVIPVDISVEDAAKIILSAGMVTPGDKTQARLKELADSGRAKAQKLPEPVA